MPIRYVQANKGAVCEGDSAAQVAVALMNHMGVHEGVAVNDQARNFARALMTEWGVGNRHCNDGVLLLLSRNPREVRAAEWTFRASFQV